MKVAVDIVHMVLIRKQTRLENKKRALEVNFNKLLGMIIDAFIVTL